MIELKLSTKRGKEVYRMGLRCQAEDLWALYNKPSSAKIQAFDECFLKYCNTESSYGFGVGNANSFSFTAKWFGYNKDEAFMQVETKDNTYLVWLNR